MTTIFDFSRRSVLVTGASSGIGRSTVERLCASGAQVVAAARNVNELARLAEETGCEPLVLGAILRSAKGPCRRFRSGASQHRAKWRSRFCFC
jgi:NAD(P)-dependent dehydrogenase (short-subunit alcohol dehydrogenase family)